MGKTNEEFIFNLREVLNVWTAIISNLSRPNVDLGLLKLNTAVVLFLDGLSMSEKKIASVINLPLPEFARQLKVPLDSSTTFVTLFQP
jgi:hypothetical protein